MTSLSLLTSDDTCTKTAGLGVTTTWTLSGTTSYFIDGTNKLDTDGYKIVATISWQSLTSYTTDAASVTISSNPAVIGTCVETLNPDGTKLAAGTVDEGNFAICHWFYYLGASNTTRYTLSGTQNTNWGETRYLTEDQWGSGGSKLVGANIQGLGKALDSTYNGFTLSAGSLTTYVAGVSYSMTWYQPPFKTVYPAGSLRRYNGNA